MSAAPPTPSRSKRVTIVLRRPASHPQTAHGLRTALGYTTVGLSVRVVLVGSAVELCGSTETRLSPATQRALATLRTLGCPIEVGLDGDELARRWGESDAVVCW